jgi:hypothetical protein
MMGAYTMPRAAAYRAAEDSRECPARGWVLDMLAMMGAAAGGWLPKGVGEPQMPSQNELQRIECQSNLKVEK